MSSLRCFATALCICCLISTAGSATAQAVRGPTPAHEPLAMRLHGKPGAASPDAAQYLTYQMDNLTLSDGSGGAIVVWTEGDHEASTPPYKIRARAIDGNGAARWPSINVRAAGTSQFPGAIVSDGAGGAIVGIYSNHTGTNYDVYAHHILASGALDPAWPANGLAVCSATGDKSCLSMVSDGAGGAFLSWQDYRAGTNTDIYAHHVLASGAVDPAVPANGWGLCTLESVQLNPGLVSDGAGGAIVVWQDTRYVYPSIVFAQHLLASGAVDPAWTSGGNPVGSLAAGNPMLDPVVISDGAHGAIISYYQQGESAPSGLFAKHLLVTGIVDSAWPAGGCMLRTGTLQDDSRTMVTDGAGGAIVIWSEYNSTTTDDLYAQHVLASGTVDPGWPANALAFCIAPGNQNFASAIPDGAGGAIVAWPDHRNNVTSPYRGWDIYAHRLLGSGTVDPAWPANGLILAGLWFDEIGPTLAQDGAGGAIVTWYSESFAEVEWPLYAQRVSAAGVTRWTSNGVTSTQLALVNAEASTSGVRLAWYAAARPGLIAALYRRGPNSDWEALADVHADGTCMLRYEDAAVVPGQRYGYRLGVFENGSEHYCGETWVDVPNHLALVLEGARPNPATRELTVAFTLARSGAVRLDLLDLSGRRVRSCSLPELDGGRYLRSLGSTAGLAPGIYHLRLTQGQACLTRRVSVLR